MLVQRAPGTTIRQLRWARRLWSALLAVLLPTLLLPTAVLAAPVTYFVDCSAGNDSYTGRSQSTAWRSLGKASAAPLMPGDSMLFKRGCTWTGTLFLRRSGTASVPITVGAYGSGSLPRIQNGVDQVAIYGSYIIIEYMHVRADPESIDTACENAPMGTRRGFRFYSGSAHNVLRHSLATELFGGIWIATGSHHNSIHHNVLRNNTMKKEHPDINDTSGATGIAVQGDDNDVGYNEVSGSNSCSRVYGRDGGAIDVFGGQRNRIHHNVARDNHIFSELGDSRSLNTTYAYNLVTATIPKAHFLTTRGAASRWGPVYGTKVYNNTVYLPGTDSWGVHCDSGCGSSVLTMRNNIIWANGTIGYSDAAFDEGHNLYWRSGGSPNVRFPMASTSQKVDPRWVAPGSDFRLGAGSAAIDSATNIALTLGFTLDMRGTNLPQGPALDRGAYEAAQGSPPPPTGTQVTDTFSRTISNGWGSAGVGGAYSIEGRASQFWVDGTEGTISLDAAGRGGSALLLGTRMRDSDSRFRVRTNKSSTGWGQTVYVVARHVAGVGEYRLNIRFAPDGTYLRTAKVVGTTQVTIGGETRAPITHVPGTSYWVRTRVSGVSPTTLQLKIWQAGQSEPTGWQHTTSDSTASLQASGSPGLRTWISGDATNAPVRFVFDDLTVTAL
jgi:hypothetical protein